LNDASSDSLTGLKLSDVFSSALVRMLDLHEYEIVHGWTAGRVAEWAIGWLPTDRLEPSQE